MSHYYANATTNFYVDGVFVGAVSERVEPSAFELRTDEGQVVALQDLLIWRAALGPQEVHPNILRVPLC